MANKKKVKVFLFNAILKSGKMCKNEWNIHRKAGTSASSNLGWHMSPTSHLSDQVLTTSVKAPHFHLPRLPAVECKITFVGILWVNKYFLSQGAFRSVLLSPRWPGLLFWAPEPWELNTLWSALLPIEGHSKKKKMGFSWSLHWCLQSQMAV